MSPIKYSFKSEIIPVLLIVAAWVFGFYFYAHFPAQVVTHWNYNGQPNGYSSKAVGAFLLPAILTFIYGLFLGLPYLDPKKERYESFAKIYTLFRGLIMGVLLVIFLTASASNLGYPIQTGSIIPIIIGLLFIVLGNYMGKIKPNWFVGIRTPWTLSSENVWNKTHRLGGFMFVLFGAGLVATPLFPASAKLLILIVGVVLASVIPMAYSYILYRKETVH